MGSYDLTGADAGTGWNVCMVGAVEHVGSLLTCICVWVKRLRFHRVMLWLLQCCIQTGIERSRSGLHGEIVRHSPGRSVEISTPSQGGFRYTRCRKDRAERHPSHSAKQPDRKELKISTCIHQNETDSTNVSARYFGRTPQVDGFQTYQPLMSRWRVAEPVSYTTMLATNDSEMPIIGEVWTAKRCSHVDII